MNINIKLIRVSFIATMAVVLYAGILFAGNIHSKEKAELRLMNQVEHMIKSTEADEDVSGKAVVTFQVADNDEIEIVDVLSSNTVLIDHVKKALDGKFVSRYALENNMKFRFELTMKDLR